MRFLFIATLAFCSCARSQDPVRRGEGFFTALGCASCHRVGSRGGDAGPDLTAVGRRYAPDWLDDWLRDPRSWDPAATMMKLQVRAETRADLVAYLASLNGEAYRRNPPWGERGRADAARRGRVLYQRLGCGSCHGEAGRGGRPNNNVVGNAVPGLTHARDGFTAAELKERIARGRRPEPEKADQPAPRLEMPGWGDFLTEDELDDLAAYLFSLGSERPTEDWSR